MSGTQSLMGFSFPTTAFSVKEGSNFTCPVGQVGWEFQLSDRHFQLSRAVGQSLMSNPDPIKKFGAGRCEPEKI